MTEPTTAIPGPRGLPKDLEGTLRREGFGLGDWRVEPRRNRIVAGDRERALDPRQIDVLVALALQPGSVLTREELLSRVWDDTFVAENTLSQAISRLRKALGDDLREPTYIETISKSGYRLVAAVAWSDGYEPPRAVADIAQPLAAAPGIRIMTGITILVALFGLAGLTWITVATRTALGTTPTTRPELTLPGNQFGARLSPDGAYVAFAWEGPEQAGWDIWVQRSGADGPVRLTDDTDDERLPAWAADGTALAFVRFSGESEACGIYRVPLPGGPVERLADCQPGMRTLDWSPDGKRLVLNGGEPGEVTRALYLHDLDTGVRRRRTDPPDGTPGDSWATFSPNGASVAFRREHSASRHDVMVIAADGSSEPRRLTDDRWGRLRGVAWSSDGKSLIYSSNRTGRFSLWRVALEGGTPQPVPVHDTWVTQPSIARERGNMIYRTFRDSVDIWELPLDDDGQAMGEPTRRVASTRSERHPAWSPRSDTITFVSDRSGTTEIWSGHRDGTSLRRHTEFLGPLPAAPNWSPDGKSIVFDAAVDGHADLWIVGQDSRRPTRWTASTSEDRNAVFSHDGATIYFASDRSGRWEIWRMPADGGDAVQITTDGGFRAQPSRDGTALYFVKLDAPGVWRMDLADGSAELVLPGLNLSDWGSWVAGDHGIYYVTRSPTTIAYAPFGEAQPLSIHQPTKQIPYLGRALSLSADGKRLLFSLIDHSDDEVMAVEQARF
jgi:Tol biopolymer transport system component/DNA-binding winged helix-turn-helix (wHTH) protein